MSPTVWIGKARRIVLEDLQSIALFDGIPEMHNNNVENKSHRANPNRTELPAHLPSLRPHQEDDSLLLSVASTRAALTLLALSIAQGRLLAPLDYSISHSLSAAIVQLIQCTKSRHDTGLGSSSSSSSSETRLLLRLPSNDASSFWTSLLDWITSVSWIRTETRNILTPYNSAILSEIRRIIPLSILSLNTIQLKSIAKIVDALAALSVERTRIDPAQYFSDTTFDLHRPHRGMIQSALILRALLHGSKFACKTPMLIETTDDDDFSNTTLIIGAVQTIPQYHGPAVESIIAACRVLELECNCFSDGHSREEEDTTRIKFSSYSNDAVQYLTARTVENACLLLLHGSHARIGSTILSSLSSPPTLEDKSLLDQALQLDKVVKQFIFTLEQEIHLNSTFINQQISFASVAAQKKAEEKMARATARHADRILDHNNNKDTDEDEFAGMSETQIAKILKKRAEKESKAAAKKASKFKNCTTSESDGTTTTTTTTTTLVVSIFGSGSMAILSILQKANLKLDDPHTITQIDAVIQSMLSGGVQRKPKIPKGTRDYLPEQMMIRDEAFQIIRRVFKSHGAVEIDTPVFELKETLTGKYGEDSKLIYDLADQGGELLALRYDLTVPFARFLSLNSVGNIKRFHIGKVYRRDQPALSKGRYREFYQCDFDIAGVYARMVPDSECLCVASEILSTLPIGEFCIKLNHRRLLDAILDLCGVPSDRFRTICSAVDKLDKEEWSEVKREMVEDKGLKAEVADKIGTFVLRKGAPWDMYHSLMNSQVFGDHVGALEAMEDLKILFGYLEAMGKLKYISFDLSLARGLDYYTGVIYEAVCMNGNTQVGSIGGGGRYDNLVSMFQESGKVTPCVGVSIGIERVFTLMEERLRSAQGGTIKQPNVKVLVAQAGENMMVERMKISKILWDANISAEFNQQENPKLKYEIADALDRCIPFMVIVGEDESKQNMCKVKDLVARTEETIHQTDLVVTLRNKGVIPVGCEFYDQWHKLNVN